VVAPIQVAKLEEQIKQLHRVVIEKENVKKSVRALNDTLDALKASVNKFDNLADKSKLLLDDVVAIGSAGEVQDYVEAEQAVMAIDLLMRATGEHELHEMWVDQLYTAVGNEDTFDPYSFTEIMQSATF
jgi:hypothetical protein